MKTTFCIFDEYGQANKTVSDLMDKQYDPQQMNAIVLAKVAQNALEGEQHRVTVEKSSQIGGITARGLDRLFGGEKAIEVHGVGQVYAAGELATNIVRNASAPGSIDGDFKDALIEFAVPEGAAGQYQTAVSEGQVLYFIRTDDQEAAKIVRLLRDSNGKTITSI
jgi:hypothetical protein